jgi:hypothetical protein
MDLPDDCTSRSLPTDTVLGFGSGSETGRVLVSVADVEAERDDMTTLLTLGIEGVEIFCVALAVLGSSSVITGCGLGTRVGIGRILTVIIDDKFSFGTRNLTRRDKGFVVAAAEVFSV